LTSKGGRRKPRVLRISPVRAAASLPFLFVGACTIGWHPVLESRDASTGLACAPLPLSSGPILEVGPSEAGALPQIVRDAPEGTTIVLADGVYRMTGDETARRIQIHTRGLTIRSASGDPSSVVIDGEYATAELVSIHASDVTIAEITLMRALDHAVHVVPDTGADITGTALYRLRITDCGEQFVHVHGASAAGPYADEGVLECSELEMTDEGRTHVEREPNGCFTGGINLQSGRDWIVRANTISGIYCAGEGLAEHAIHAWDGARGTLVEQNRIVDCARGIGLGLNAAGTVRVYDDDPYPGLFVDHFEGVVRNNVIVARTPHYDTGIELAQARGAAVHHQTIVETADTIAALSSIDARYANTLATVQNNLVRRLTVREDANMMADHNVEMMPFEWLADAESGDVHLRESADGAIDRGVALEGAGLDLDGEPHDRGAGPDIGADER
jgi:hypothetical protein